MNKMKKLHIAIDFESQSLDVSVNDAHECVTPATTVEEMYAKEVFTFRPVNESRYVILHYADIVADGSCFTVGKKLEVVEKFLRESPCGGFVRVNRSAIANLRFIKGYEGNTLKLLPHSSLTIGQNSREVCPLETGKMNKCKRSLKDFVWKGDCFGKKWL